MKHCCILFTFIYFAVASCNNKDAAVSVHKRAGNKITIDIQPFTGITKPQAEYVFAALKKIFTAIEIKPAIDLPKQAWYPQRSRYRADSLIRFLSGRTAPGHTVIGLTNKDISTTKGAQADWGVMGLSYCPGKACIASSFRLSKKETNLQLFKVAIHELGHTQGLPHCAVKFCFMRDAEGGNPTDEEKEFCTKCTSFLKSKGWKLN